MGTLSSWGRLSCLPHRTVALHDRTLVAEALQQNPRGICFAMGRSYGDICLNPRGVAWLTRSLDRFISFDSTTGLIECETGVTLGEIQRLFVPRGWMLPVSPGTQFATVGGAIANDIHGKNHHAKGSFGNHVRFIELMRTTGEVLRCSPEDNPGLFAATIGGMGLTGVITRALVQLRPVPGPWLATDTLPFTRLEEFFELSDISEEDWEYTVSWIDCVGGAAGRGIFMRANHTPYPERRWSEPRRRQIPFTPPFSLVNGMTLKPFNQLYYARKAAKAGAGVEHYANFFYPLDSLLDWNRLYGRPGFYQFQCVVPREAGLLSIREMLTRISEAGEGSMLAVLKTFGNALPGTGLMSFPMPGVTLALDFPNRGARTISLLASLEAIVRDAGGRLYPAKDAAMSRHSFERGYPRLEEFMTYRDHGTSSALSRRLLGL